MKKYWKSPILLLAPLLVVGLQFGMVGAAQAAGGSADLGVYGYTQFSNRALGLDVCNHGDDPVEEFVLDFTTTNVNISGAFVFPASDIDNGSTLGVFDLGTKTWNGTLNNGDCINVTLELTETAPIGSSISIETHIASSKLAGSVANVDTNTGNDTHLVSYTSVQASNLDVSTRLLTGGQILPDTEVTYEATGTNVGPGDYVENGFFILAFVMPVDATYIDGADADLGDSVDLLGCQVIGSIGSLGFQALDDFDYVGNVVACSLQATQDLPAGTSFKLNFKLKAGTEFAAGNAEVIVIVEGNDADTLSLFRALALGTDPLASNNGNALYLSYDPTALAATASLCPGQAAVSTDGTACFRIQFNKKIVDASFTKSDIVITGSGTVQSLTKLAGTEVWEVRIVDIAPGKSAELSLNTAEVVDYSAVESQTSVLGITTIRFEPVAPAAADSGKVNSANSANGTLASTGANASNSVTAASLLVIGFALAFAARKKRALL